MPGFENLAQVIGSRGASPATIEQAFRDALADAGFAEALAPFLVPFLKTSGVATLATGTTAIVVAHGLASTPTADQIMVTPIEAWGSATQFWVDTITATEFTINVDANPLADVDFAWRADVA